MRKGSNAQTTQGVGFGGRGCRVIDDSLGDEKTSRRERERVELSMVGLGRDNIRQEERAECVELSMIGSDNKRSREAVRSEEEGELVRFSIQHQGGWKSKESAFAELSVIGSRTRRAVGGERYSAELRQDRGERTVGTY
jgi:hypothetical protein